MSNSYNQMHWYLLYSLTQQRLFLFFSALSYGIPMHVQLEVNMLKDHDSLINFVEKNMLSLVHII